MYRLCNSLFRATLTPLPFQTIFFNFFVTILGCADDAEEGRETFDLYAADNDGALARGISISGETKDYFAQRRIEWLRDCLRLFSARVTILMDFGCGTGSSSPLFLTYSVLNNLSGRTTQRNHWRSRDKRTAQTGASSSYLMHINPLRDSIWFFVMGFFITSPYRSEPMLLLTSYDHSSRAGILPSGRTIRGIQEPAT